VNLLRQTYQNHTSELKVHTKSEQTPECVRLEEIKIKDGEELQISELEFLFSENIDYTNTQPITIDTENYIVDGRKRFILALHQGLESILVNRINHKLRKVY